MTKVAPFSNGTEYMIWRSKNCDICKKDCPYDDITGNYGDPLCDIEVAIALASIGSGEIDSDIANRAGLCGDHAYANTCKEIEYNN